MKTRRIDALLKMLENHAGEELAEQLDTHPDYQAICALLAEIDVNGHIPTFTEKMNCYNQLRSLFIDFRMNYDACVKRIIEMELIWEEN